MANIADIMARARVIATGMGIDPTASPVIDNKPALRALLDTALSDVYRKRAEKGNSFRDIAVRNTVALIAGVGTVPTGIMRDYLHLADFTTAAGDLVSYLNYPMDANSFSRYQQLGYVIIQGDTFLYTTPNSGAAYTGDMYVTAVTLPDLSLDPLVMTSEVIDDVAYTLALALRGDEKLT